MHTYIIEQVWADGRDATPHEKKVTATNFSTAMARAIRLAKPRMKRGVKKVTVTLVQLKDVKATEI